MSLSEPVILSIDGEARLIYLDPAAAVNGVLSFHPIDDIYIEYRNRRRVEPDIRQYSPLLEAAGMVPKGGGKFTPRYILLLNGTKIVIPDQLTGVVVTGEVLTDDQTNPFDTSLVTGPVLIQYQPSEAEVIQVGGGEGVADWITLEKAQLRYRLGIDGTKSVPVSSTPDLGTLAKQDAILDALDNISVGSSGINTSAIDFTLPIGNVVTGTFNDARTLNGVYHQLEDDNTNLEAEYVFNVGRDGVPSTFTFIGRLFNNNDAVSVEAWNWNTDAWEQLGILQGKNQPGDVTIVYNMLHAHVGTGTDFGQVLVRFIGTGLSDSDLYIDQIFVGYAVVQRHAGFIGAVVSATANTITLQDVASSINNYYRPGLVVVTAGTGVDQYGRIESYDGDTRTLTMATDFAQTLDSSSIIEIYPWGSVRVSDIDSAVITAAAFAEDAIGADTVSIEAVEKLQAGLAIQSTQLFISNWTQAVWRFRGLDIANPVTVTPNSISSGGVTLNISGDGVTTSIITRA
jgi:hypothetical protein